MLKKIVLGALMVGLVGALVAGAVNRTQSKLGGEVSENGGNRQGQVQQLPQDAAADLHAERETERSTEDADSAASQGGSGAVAAGARGGWRSGNAEAGRGQEAEPAEAGERITLDGVVEAVDAEALVVKLPDGRTVEIANRGWLFAREQGFAAQPGDQVTLAGVYDGEAFEAAGITDHTNGQSVTLRDVNGRPMWAGRGRSG